MSTPEADSHRAGLYAAFGAYLSWGFIVVYFKLLHMVDAPRILAHRSLWAALSLVLIITVMKQWGPVRAVLRNTRMFWTLVLTAFLIGSNWLVFIWAVNHGHVLQGALGYYINPLMNVLLGVWLLGERLRRWQMVAIALAALGVLNQAITVGKPPIVSLFLASTFAIYGLLRKRAAVDARTGLFVEMAVLTAPALLFLGWYQATQGPAFAPGGPFVVAMLLASGVITAAPLMLFAVAARRLTLTTLGLMQFIAPTVQFLLGVVVYDEPFVPAQGLTFVLIWVGLAVFMGEALWRERSKTIV